MDWRDLEPFLTSVSLWRVAATLYASMAIAAYAAMNVRRLRERRRPPSQSDLDANKGAEAYIVSAVLGLLALLLGFSFSLAVDRYDARRLLVRDEANAIGEAYFRAQLLDEPDRTRTSQLLVAYLDLRITLAQADDQSRKALLSRNDALINDLWAATAAALDGIKCYDWSSTYLDTMNTIVTSDASRKAARIARVPFEVFVVLFVYMITTAAVLGYVLRGNGGRVAAGVLLALLTMTLAMIVDIDGPLGGAVVESQRPMELLRARIAAYPPSVFQKWRTAQASRPAACGWQTPPPVDARPAR
ncbi:hypothetical protein LJR164_001504 [Phenylobacterium sp. LjRoot164]|uniref:bestrophin-like domain n=1 Tax=unclassified Phenylobacterium TaxID=2640670 RepID=UPI003ED09811